MTMLILQILLLMLAAYFIGAALACGLRKMFAPQRRVTSAEVMAPARPVEPLARPQPPRAAQPETVSRFEKALGSETPRPAPQPAVAPPPPRVAPAAPITPPAVAPVVAAATPVVTKAVHTHAPVEAPHPTPPADLVVPPPPRITLTAPPTPAAGPVQTASSSAMAAGVATAAAAAAAAASVSSGVARATPAATSAPTPAPAQVVAPVVAKPVTPVAATTAVQPSAAPVAAQAPLTDAADDLTRIRGIDTAIAAGLKGLGVMRYSQIASWMRPDVSRVNQALGFKHRVERENWIEQAHILAGRGETLYARRMTGHQAGVVQPTAVIAAPTAPAPVPPPPGAPIATVATPTPAVRPAMTAPGIAAAAAAAAAAASAAAPRAQPVQAQPVQAQPLQARPVQVQPAAARPVTAPVPPPTPSPARVVERAAFETAPRLPPQAVSTPVNVTAPVTAAAPSAVAYPPLPAAQPVRPSAMAPTRDPLQRISGINSEIEKLLYVQGVTRYSQIAGWGAGDVERFDRLLGSPGRVQRESWIEQAQMLSKGGETSGARAPAAVSAAAQTPLAQVKPAQINPTQVTPPAAPASAISAVAAATAAAAASAAAAAAARPARLQDAIQSQQSAPVSTPASAEAVSPRSDLSNLRSVRSEAFQPASGGTRGASLDDLKRIRGVGVLIEKRLNALGVTGYEQIANWTQDDIARYSQQLDFKGRIERENWVEQARILASGGFTEFSRRVDRGEVETSRPKT